MGVAPFCSFSQVTPDDLANWDMHCFCIEATATPQRIIRMDENGKLLLRAQNGASVQQLRAEGVKASDSQLTLLRLFGLLTQNGDQITTRFPIIGPKEMAHTRAISRSLSTRISKEILPQVRAINTELARNQKLESAYAVVFGYALDVLLWEQMQAMNVLPATKLTAEQPFWRGAFWAAYPERVGAAGVNKISAGNTALMMVWTQATTSRINSFSQTKEARDVLAAVKSAPDSPVLPATFRAPDGQVLFPVIQEQKDDLLYNLSTAIAAVVVRMLSTTADGQALLASIPGTTKSEAMVIVTHELIWDVSETLVESKALVYPAILSRSSKDASLVPLLFARVSK